MSDGRNQQVTGGEEGMRLPIAHVPEWLVGVVNTRNLYWFALIVLVIVYLVVLWVIAGLVTGLAIYIAAWNRWGHRAIPRQPAPARSDEL